MIMRMLVNGKTVISEYRWLEIREYRKEYFLPNYRVKSWWNTFIKILFLSALFVIVKADDLLRCIYRHVLRRGQLLLELRVRHSDYRQSGYCYQWSPIVLLYSRHRKFIHRFFRTKSPLMTANMPVSFKVRNIFWSRQVQAFLGLFLEFFLPSLTSREKFVFWQRSVLSACRELSKYHRETQDNHLRISPSNWALPCNKSKPVFAWLTRGVPRAWDYNQSVPHTKRY